MDAKTRLVECIRKRSFLRSDKPVFRLTSGKMSSFFFDLKKTTCSAEGQYLVGNLVFDKIIEAGLAPKAIGGLTIGADPIASATAYTSFLRNNPIEAMVIRKEPKGHGTMRRIEGNVKAGDEVIIIDDVVTTGGSTIRAMDAAEEAGLKILAVIVLLDRCEFGGRENIESRGYPVYSILTIRDFLQESGNERFLP
jgi:orotate phosphoribosyltransferase